MNATIMYMTTLSVAAARSAFSKLVDSASSTHERFEVTRNGRRAAVLLGAEDYDALIETLDILSDPELMADLREAEQALEDGQGSTVDEVREEMVRNGRRVP